MRKKNDSENYVAKLFVIIALIFGFTFSFLIPFYQTPDEYSHYSMIYNETGIKDNFNEQVKDYNDSYRIIINYDEKVNINKNLNLKYKFNIKNIKINFNINIIKHFPQNIVLFITSILNFPIFIGTTISELCALLFYIFICYKALKKMPIKKELMMFIMLLPMSIQQASSVSYDVILLSMCHLFIAELFYIKFEKNNFENKDLLKLIIILAIISIVKLPYSLLGMLIFLIPIDKYNLNLKLFNVNKNFFKKNKIKLLIILFLLFLIFLFLAYLNRYKLLKIELFRIFVSFILSPIDSFMLISRTLISQCSFYIESFLGNFGWLDTPTPFILRLIIFIVMIIMIFVNFDNKKIKQNYLKKWEKIFLIVLFFIILLVIMIPMYSWSLGLFGIENHESFSVSQHINQFKNMDYIAGVQGRYLIPIVILLMLPFNSEKLSKILKKIKINKVLYLYFLIVYIWIVVILLLRYWIK